MIFVFLKSEADLNVDFVLIHANGHINVVYSNNAKNKPYLNFRIHNHQVHELKCDAKINQKCRWYIEIEVLDEVEVLELLEKKKAGKRVYNIP